MKVHQLVSLLLQCDPDALAYGAEGVLCQVVIHTDSVEITEFASAKQHEAWKADPATSRLRDYECHPLQRNPAAFLVWLASEAPAQLWRADYGRSYFHGEPVEEMGSGIEIDGDDADWIAQVPKALEWAGLRLRGEKSTKVYELNNGDLIVVGHH